MSDAVRTNPVKIHLPPPQATRSPSFASIGKSALLACLAVQSEAQSLPTAHPLPGAEYLTNVPLPDTKWRWCGSPQMAQEILLPPSSGCKMDSHLYQMDNRYYTLSSCNQGEEHYHEILLDSDRLAAFPKIQRDIVKIPDGPRIDTRYITDSNGDQTIINMTRTHRPHNDSDIVEIVTCKNKLCHSLSLIGYNETQDIEMVYE